MGGSSFELKHGNEVSLLQSFFPEFPFRNMALELLFLAQRLGELSFPYELGGNQAQINIPLLWFSSLFLSPNQSHIQCTHPT